MEFPNLGEYHDNLSLEEAIRIYQEIPAEQMNGIKGIGFELKDGSDYEGPFPILTGQTIDLDTIQAIDYYRDNPLVQKAVTELAAAMPEMEVLGADANQQDVYKRQFLPSPSFCKNRGKTAIRRKWRLKASPMRSANILALRPEKTASAILQAGVRARN